MALDSAGKIGKGVSVIVPAGLYLVGNLVIPAHTTLHIDEGAVLKFTGKPKDYKQIFNDDSPQAHKGTMWIRTEDNARGARITGGGTLDASGLETLGYKYLAQVLVPKAAQDFEANGLLIRDSSHWAVAVTQSTDVRMYNMKVLSRFSIANTVGFAVIQSEDVKIKRAIAIGRDDSYTARTFLMSTNPNSALPGRGPHVSQNIVFDDCLAWTYNFAYRVGPENVVHQRNIKFQNSVAYKAGAGLGVHHKWGQGYTKNITFENIDIERLQYTNEGFSAWLVLLLLRDNQLGQEIGSVDGIVIKNVRARAAGRWGSYLQGVDELNPIRDVRFQDIYMGKNKKPAKTLKEMKVTHVLPYSKDIFIQNNVVTVQRGKKTTGKEKVGKPL